VYGYMNVDVDVNGVAGVYVDVDMDAGV